MTAANCTAVTSCSQPAATICPLVKLCPDNSTVSVTVLNLQPWLSPYPEL